MVIIGGRAHSIEHINAIGKLGYPYAEVSLLDPAAVESQLRVLLELKQRYGIYYIAHYPNEDNPFDTSILEKKFVPKMERLFDLSQRLGIIKGTMHFWMDKRWASSELITNKIEMLSRLVSYAKKKDVTICLENLSERYSSFADAFQAIDDLRMTLDIGHGQLLSSQNTAFDFIRKGYDRIAHLHVHDNFGGTSVKDDLHLALGDGVVDYRGIFTLLKNKGYGSSVTMEVKLPDMPRTKKTIEQYF
ncbi:MAG: sugar phosphate isomerase/epimerase [Deltaproteobacteria bacterium]|nr:sugar phosphate isomerase/epimerase [Deltaproteobacteria bacterium]